MEASSTLILFIGLGIAAWLDYFTQRVAAWFTWALLILGVCLPSPWGGLLWRLGGFGGTFILLAVLIFLIPEGLGGSDARAIMAFGAYFAHAFAPYLLLLGLCQPVFLLLLRIQRKNADKTSLGKGAQTFAGEDGGPFLPFLLLVAAFCFALLQ